MCRARLLLSLWIMAGLSNGALAAPASSWTISSAEEFRQGTLEGTAQDGEGRVRLAPTLDRLWGPGEGIVWDLEPADPDGVFVALSTPTRVLRVAPGREPQVWYESGDEGLVAAILPDGDGGLYFGLSPDGRLFHAEGPGDYAEAVDTGALFIWALAPAADGSVWIGTGLPGRLLRFGPEGQLRTVFDSADDPVRCILPLDDGAVVFGTGGRGQVIRVDAAGRAFVIFDADEAEIVALEIDASGSIYALAAQGSKQLAAAKSTAVPTASNTVRVTAKAPAENDADDAERDQAAPDAQRADSSPRSFRTTPGGALYRIARTGDYRKIWSSPREVPFGLAWNADDTILVATGDSGRIHAVDHRGRSSILLKIPSDQASALTRAPDGRIFVGGTTDARVERIGPGLRSVGRYLSRAHDVGTIADWGRMRWETELPAGTEVRAAVRVGNTAEPDGTWSDWVDLGSLSGARMELPAARWIQAGLELRASQAGLSPLLRSLELFFQPHNRRPVITELVVQPAGVVWTRNVSSSSRQTGPLVTLDPVVRKTVAGLKKTVGAKSVRKSYELGARTASWKVSDPDGDALTCRLDIRREGSSVWIPLAVGIEEDFLGWDARGMRDGLYRVRLEAVDARDNPAGKQLEDRQISAAFHIDNTRPSIGDPRIQRNGRRYELEFVASDPGGNLAAAEVAVDSGDWQPLDPLDGVADSAEERYLLVIDPAEDDGAVGRQRTVRVRVTDWAGNMGGDAWVLDPEATGP